MSDISKRIANLSPEKRALLTKKLQEQQKHKISDGIIGRRPDSTHYPMSFAQQRMWFLSQWEPENPFYNIFSYVKISGPLNVNALEMSINEVIKRHEVTRSRYVSDNGIPIQVIDPEFILKLTIIDISLIQEHLKREKLSEVIDKESKSGFNIAEDHLLRGSLVKISDNHYVMMLTMHHIISDGWSLRIFIREVLSLYDSYLSGGAYPLKELDLQYSDFAFWQKNRLQGEVYDNQLTYWKSQFKDKNLILELPIDYPRPPVQTFNGAIHRFSFPPQLTRELRNFCKQNDVSLFMVLLAGYHVLLYRYSNQDEIRVGFPIANRSREEIENLIGLFVNTLVIEVSFYEGITAGELIKQLRDKTLNALQNQELPLEMLIEELDIVRDLRYTPLFQVMFSYQEALDSELHIKDLQFEVLENDSSTAKFDLTLFIEDTSDDLRGIFEFNTDLFSKTTIESMSVHYLVLLSSLIRNLSQPVSRLPILTEQEKEQILITWNDTFTDYPADKTLIELFDIQVLERPEEIALRFPGKDNQEEILTYSELNNISNQIAHYLQKLDVKPDDLIGIYMERSMLMVITTLAVIKSGGAYLPLDTSYPIERTRFMLEDCDVTILLTETRFMEKLDLHVPVKSIVIDEKSGNNRKVLCLDDPEFQLKVNNERKSTPLNRATPEHLAYVMYTSGSTGTPKGVAIPQRAIIRLLFNTNYIHIDPSDRIAHASNPSFDAATLEIWGALLHGAQLVGVTREVALSPNEYAEYLRKTGITTLFLTPALFNQIVRELPDAFSTLKHLMVGGEQMDVQSAKILVEGKPPKKFSNVYGPTESTTYTTTYDIESIDDNAQVIPIGRPISNTVVYILDQYLQPVPIGVPGELYIGGDGLARGYFRRPDVTRERFVINPYHDLLKLTSIPYERDNRIYKTGDLVRYLQDGNIEFIGRLDFQVKLRGLRIELGEIESNIAKFESIVESVVMMRDDSRGEKRIVAYLVSKSDEKLDTDSLREFLKSKLPEYMIPSVFISLDQLPINENGKVDRKRLPEPNLDEMTAQVQYIAPRNHEEELLSEIWKELLGLKIIGVTENFFSLGGHSLLVTQLVSRIRSSFNVDISIKTIFEHPIIQELSMIIAEKQKETIRFKETVILPRENRNEFVLSFAQQRLWFLDQLQPGSPEYNIPFAMIIRGKLDPDILVRSVNQILFRHEVLRTRILTIDGKPFVKIIPNETIDLQYIDLTIEKSIDPSIRIRDLLCKEAQTPFDLEKDQLLRILLIKKQQEETILFLNMHHIISDGWSSLIFFNELSRTYAAELVNQSSSLEPLTLQYYDYSAWQRGWLQGEVLDKGIEFWQKYLDNIPALLELPTDFPRPAITSGKGSMLNFEIDENLSLDIKALAKKRDATFYMLFLSAFYLLLYRYGSQCDIVIGSPSANRSQIDLETLIGLFVNTIAIRVNPSEPLNFLVLLDLVKDAALNSFLHSEIPFEMVIQAIQPERDLSYTPIFQVMFDFQEKKKFDDGFKLSGLELVPMDVNVGTAKFDLTLTIADEGDLFRGGLEYRTDLFLETTAVRIIDHLINLLRGVVENPTTDLSMVPLLDDFERNIVLYEWNNRHFSLPEPSLIHQLITERAKIDPEKTAVEQVVDGITSTISYSALDRESDALACYLRSKGVGPDVIVGICLEKSINMIVGLIGILKAGGAYLPLDPIYPDERIKYMVEDSGVSIILSQDGIKERLTPYMSTVITLDSEWQELKNKDLDDADIHAKSMLFSDNLAYVIYTSGSTGQPKGVMVTHQGVVNHNLNIIKTFELTRDDRVLQFSTLNFDTAVEEIFPTLIVGATLILPPKEMLTRGLLLLSGDELSNLIETERLTVIDLPTAFWHEWVLQQEISGQILPECLRLVVVGGEKAFRERFDQWNRMNSGKVKWLNTYGPSEGTVIASTFSPEDGFISEFDLPIGKPISNSRLFILDQNMQPLPIGIPGELFIGGKGVAKGYLHKPDLTIEKFLPDPFNPGEMIYRTGDRARWLVNGNVEFLGRWDDQVKVRGFRVELNEIELALREHDEISEAVVIAEKSKTDKTSDVQRLLGYTVLEKSSQLTGEDIRNYLKNKLPFYMVPAAIYIIEVVPLMPNGKVDRHALSLIRPEPNQTTFTNEEMNEKERIIADIWADVLGIDRVGIDDNFFSLGGDSIQSIQVVARSNQAGLRITARQMFEAQTVRRIASLAEEGLVTKMEQGLVTGSVELSPIQKWFFEQEFDEFSHWNQSLIFEVAQPLDITVLSKTIQSLMIQHDLLRARFTLSDKGDWKCIITSETTAIPLNVVDLNDTTFSNEEEILVSLINQYQSSLNIMKGPIFRFIYFKNVMHKKDKLCIIIHHLVVDGVSWRILLEDLVNFYLQIQDKGAPVYPLKTTSFQEYSEFLKKFANHKEVIESLNYWHQIGSYRTFNMPRDFPEGENTQASVGKIQIVFSINETELLLRFLPAQLGTSIQDALLTALAISYERWTGSTNLLLELEGHGREEIDPQIDVSRTVGWFTTLFPILIRLKRNVSIVEQLVYIKEQLAQIPNQGLSYGILRYLSEIGKNLTDIHPEINFNYLGQIIEGNSKNQLVSLSSQSTGYSMSPRGKRSNLLEITGSIVDAELQMEWRYSTLIHKENTIRRFISLYENTLKEIISECENSINAGSGMYLATDSVKIGISQDEIDLIMEEIDDSLRLEDDEGAS